MSKFNYIYADPSLTASEWACSISGGIFNNIPYGTYAGDNVFCSESIDVCKWTARRLGHPVMQLEMNSGSIYAMFEESISEYSQHINSYNMKNWLWDQYGAESKLSGSQWQSSTTGSGSYPSMGTGSFDPIHPHMGASIVLSDQYGQAVGVGGNATLHSGSVTLVSGQQDYDLQSVYSASVSGEGLSETSKRIEIQKVFNVPPAALSRFYDPYVGTYDQRMMLDQFGFASYSPATTFILRPISYDILRAQTIETSDAIRKSNYSFEITNNIVKIFPRPVSGDDDTKLWFEYYVKDDKFKTNQSYTSNKVSDPSNAPYKFITYNEINAVGRQWIRKYCLALSKELLGIIRSKYASMPLPNGEVALDGESLKTEGREEKSQLLEELKEFLDSVSLTERTKQESEQAEAQQSVLNKAPLSIYIG